MIIVEKHPEITTVGIGQEEHFTIGNVGRIIKILRDSMYADPIKAIAREISCNARDAHREIGTPDLPIEIHLPNDFDSNYKIKDFGPGISPERMSNVFLGYGNSTKSGDNSQTGGFGLGAKTPFAYADQFTVTSISKNADGVNTKRVYIMYIGANESGTSRLVSEFPTDEHTGTEISIDVAKHDYDKFIRATVSVCNYWTVRPIITGISTFTWNHDVRKRICVEKDWELCDSGNPIIVIDGIEYPLNSYSTNYEYNSPEYKAAHIGLIIRFNTGDLTLSANREQLQYDERTKLAIKNRAIDIINQLPVKVNESFSSCASYLAAVEMLNSIKCNLHWLNVTPIWNNMTVVDQVWYNCDRNSTEDVEYGWSYNIKICSNNLKRTREQLDVYQSTSFHVRATNKIIINNTNQISKKTVQHYIKSNPGIRNVIIISSNHTKWKEVLERMQKDCSAGVNPSIFGIEYLSNLPKPPVEKRTYNKSKIKYSCYLYNPTYKEGRKQNHYWEPVSEVPEDGVYVTIHGPGNHIMSNDINISIQDISNFSNLSDEPVYAFRTTKIDDLDSDDWTQLLDRSKEIVLNKITDANITLQEVAEIHAHKHNMCNSIGYGLYEILKRASCKGVLSDSSHAMKLLREFEEINDKKSETSSLFSLAQKYNMLTDIKTDHIVDRDFGKEFYAAYPILQHITYWPTYNVETMANDAITYIQICDKNTVDVVLTMAAE